jgi:hypothetical protein
MLIALTAIYAISAMLIALSAKEGAIQAILIA